MRQRSSIEQGPGPAHAQEKAPKPAKEVSPFAKRFEAARAALVKDRKLPLSTSARELFMEMSKHSKDFTSDALRKRFEDESFSPEEQRWFSELASLNAFERAAEAEQKARFDGLTGLHRNHVLEQGLKREIEKRRDPAYRAGSLSAFYADIDHFKAFNDQYKHQTGDLVLQMVGRVIRETIERAVKEGRIAADAYSARRYDRGEEMVGVFPGTETDRMREVLEEIRSRLSDVVVKDTYGKVVPEKITMSIGIAEVGDADTLDSFLRKIERAALYAKEELGRDAVAVYSPEVETWAKGKEAPSEEEPGVEALVAGTVEEGKQIPQFRSGEEPPESIRNAVVRIREQVFDLEFPTPDQFLTQIKGASEEEETEAFLYYSQMVESRTLHLERLSSRDTLTGVENRTTLIDRLEYEVAIAQRERVRAKEGKPYEVSVLLIDLDLFKLVNDDLGHDKGDEILRETGKRFREFTKRSKDLIAQTGRHVGRYGGEEFVIVLSGTSKAEALKAAEQVRALFDQAVMKLSDGREQKQTISIGVASISDFEAEEPISVSSLLEKADVALYCSKDPEEGTGRNRTTAFDPMLESWYEKRKLDGKRVR